ncbi:hypothetical protein HAX54_016065, partial [Datura stramonium]|nr:hypothetical protein [Datura stramonium]
VTEEVTPLQASDRSSLDPSKSGSSILNVTEDLTDHQTCEGPSLRPSLRPDL